MKLLFVTTTPSTCYMDEKNESNQIDCNYEYHTHTHRFPFHASFHGRLSTSHFCLQYREMRTKETIKAINYRQSDIIKFIIL